MVEHTEFTSVVHESVSTAKEIASKVQEKIAHDSFAGDIRISVVDAQTIATVLRINANLTAGLLEENSRIHDHLNTLLRRV